MEIGKRRKWKVQILGIFCFVSITCYMVFTNEGVIDFWHSLHHRMSEFQPYLSHDVNDVKLLLWTRTNRNTEINLNMSSLVLPEEFNM